ncbi:MAG: ribulose-phosphate 3-epimerase [Thermoplasmata archaeon]|nr:MAG: ribulose-phosphate 3-epimerase [Thermoplasmata archaeon]
MKEKKVSKMKHEKVIIPAIIAKTQDELNQRLLKVKDFVNIIQLDIMDNKFVPNSSLFFDFKLPETHCLFEAHLMINKPEEWIEHNWRKVDTILVHYETCSKPEKIIKKVKEKHKKIGFVLNPETPVENINSFLDDIDQVLIMTVNPGFYGSPFLRETLKKISTLRNMKPNIDIEVDGGVTPETISLVDKAGANMFVSGSYIMKAENVEEAVNNLRNKLTL